MKILVSIIAFLLVATVAVAGFFLYQKSNVPPPAPESVSQPKATVTQRPPATPFEVPKALQTAIERNRDTVAWLEVPGTDISNSVVQTLDNEFYLRRNEAKENEVYGCYFADYECAIGAREVLKPNTIIYGHSSPGDDPDGKRFSQLHRFANPDFAKITPCVYLTTEEEHLTFEIFAVFYTHVNDFDYIRVNIPDEEMLGIAQRAQELSIYDYGKTLLATDRILTLSTCTEKFGLDGNHRFVIMARLLPDKATAPTTAEIIVK